LTALGPVSGNSKLGRNDPCHCGSGRKFKQCCLRAADQAQLHARAKSSYDEGNGHFAQSRYAEAERCFRSAIVLRPDFAQAHVNLGNCLLDQGKSEPALASFRRALELQPEATGLYMNVGLALHALQRFDEAISSYRRCLSGQNGDAQVYCNLAAAQKDAQLLDDAIASYRSAMAKDPAMVVPHHHIGNILVEQGLLYEGIASFQQLLTAFPHAHATLSSVIFTMLYSDRNERSRIAEAARLFTERFEVPLRAQADAHANVRDPQRRLKVGYVSGDFRDHSVAFFIEPIFEHHDRSQVEVFAYYTLVRKDATTARLREAADHWRECIDLSDAAMAAQIRSDGIDILVDLSGHTDGNRLLVFARKPAPVQVSWIGSPVVSGLKSIEYFLTDAQASPLEAAQSAGVGLAEEGLVRLPEVFSVYRPPQAPPVQPTPALASGQVTLGSFNKFAKMSDRSVALWSRLLGARPGFTLLLKDAAYSDAEVRERTFARFAAHGVAPGRLRLVGRLAEKTAHLAMYGDVDIALDTYPYCGVTTTCEALWMGVPVVSLVGDAFVSRMGATLLHAIGQPQWAVADEDAFVARVLELAADLGRLNDLRLGLRAQMDGSALRQEAVFTRHLEDTYRRLWHDWCART
jgi:predicted O-linked N-acetylglucosamine transferase (SPINDLY family)